MEQVAIDDIGESPLETAERLFRGVAFSPLAQVVGAPGGVAARLAGRHDMQRVVELPIASPGEPVAGNVTAGGFDRGDATVGREVRCAGEAVNVPHPAQNLGGEDRPDTEQVRRGSSAML
jgi:hypothetical protein